MNRYLFDPDQAAEPVSLHVHAAFFSDFKAFVSMI